MTHPKLEKFKTFNHHCENIIETVMMVLLIVMTASIAWQIFGRYILNHPAAWTLSLSLLLMTYIVMLMVAVGVRKQFHLQLWIIIDRLMPMPRKYLLFFHYILILIFALCMTVYGLHLTYITWQQTIPVLNIPEGINYIAICLSGLFIISFTIEWLIEVLVKPTSELSFLTHHTEEKQ